MRTNFILSNGKFNSLCLFLLTVFLSLPNAAWAWTQEDDKFKYELNDDTYMFEIIGLSSSADPTTSQIGIMEYPYGYYDPMSYTPVEGVAVNAFENNQYITNIYFDSGFYSESNYYFRSFGEAAFKNCSQLAVLSLQRAERLCKIGKECFAGTIIEEVELPASMEELGDKAFYNTTLQTVTLLSKTPYSIKTIGTDVFNTEVEGFRIVVPRGTKTAYVADDSPWKMYAPYIEETPEFTFEDGNGFSDIPESTYYESYLKMQRTFPAGKYASLCLPFDICLKDYQDQIDEVYTPMNTIIHNISDASNDYYIMMLDKRDMATENIGKGKVMLIKLKEGKDKDVAVMFRNSSDIIISSDLYDANAEKYDRSSLVTKMKVVDWDGKLGIMPTSNVIQVNCGGAFEAKTGSQSVYEFKEDGSFAVKVAGKINPFRMYLKVTDAATQQALVSPIRMSIGVGGGTTDIDRIAADMEESAKASKIYTLDGRMIGVSGNTRNLPKGVYIMNGKKIVKK